MTTPDDYNATQLRTGALAPSHLTTLVRYWQTGHGLDADGLAGPRTITSLAPVGALAIDAAGWLSGPGVTVIAAHTSWYGAELVHATPAGIVAHTTDTDPGTALTMAKRRTRKFGVDPDDRAVSWHLSIETDGAIVQMVPMTHTAWHAGGPTAQPVPGLGAANYRTVGIELVGWGKTFPAAQVAAARTVWRALIGRYGIAREHAMITHQSIDPTSREDPGPVWTGQHAADVLAFAYA